MPKQTSRKLIIYMLLAVFAYSLIGCSSSSNDSAHNDLIIGKWQSEEITGSDVTEGYPDTSYSATFKADGTFILNFKNEPLIHNGSWNFTNTNDEGTRFYDIYNDTGNNTAIAGVYTLANRDYLNIVMSAGLISFKRSN